MVGLRVKIRMLVNLLNLLKNPILIIKIQSYEKKYWKHLKKF
jgi:hypothetical protein